MHRPGGLPDRTRHRRAGRRAAGGGADRRGDLLHRSDRCAAAARRGAGRGGRGGGGAGRGRRGGPGRGHRGDDHRHGGQGGRARRPGRLAHRRVHQGCRHDRSVDGHHADRAHHRRRARRFGTTRRPTRRGAGQLRPAGHRRFDVHQRHRAAARLRRVRDGARTGRVHRRADRRLPGPGRADAGGRRGCHQADQGAGDRRRRRGRRGDHRPLRGAGQPGQDRAVRLRPELGAGSRGRRVRRGAARPGAAGRDHQRCPALPGWGRGRRSQRRRPDRQGRVGRGRARAGRWDGGDPDHRPVARVRGGEQCLLQ